MANNHSPLAVQEMQILHYLKQHGESHTNDLHAEFEEFETRKQMSAALGNMKQAGLIAKHNPGRWSLTGVGREMLDLSGYPNNGLNGETVCAESPEPTDVLQLLEKLQEQVPENASLVIERGELFFVVARQKFEIQWPGDFEAMSLVADRYIGQVA
ncbi:hypothetical protein GCM10011533_30050 [Streptosporangium jomthongense]|uniref:Uncharacterized protein n=1 Tax=Marinobacter aromaticivorans TaxID=1494078 RepID=A0ABW2IYG9_9GAMM|nr:hypothetical protein [Marinobacter aromaticivorans]GGE75693.1 hypothetical protein GCM10011533_30050 [Streptosporangium jomthongense]